MRITVFGCGYVGLVTGACLAKIGHHVRCVDIDEVRISTLNAGNAPFQEAGLTDLLSDPKLTFSTQPDDCDLCIIATGSPLAEDGSADLAQVFAASEQITQMKVPPKAIVVKSTVPVGTAAKIADLTKVEVISNPEFLRQGCAVNDFMHPDRLIIGAGSQRGVDLMSQLYAPLDLPNDRIVKTSNQSAELTKYAANVFLTTKLAFVNELALYCETVGANIDEVAKGIGLDHRIGPQFLKAGPGIGGSCFPKDIRALARQSKDLNHHLEIVDAVIESNEKHQHAMFEKIMNMCDGSVKDKNIAVLGVTFKAETDDLRNSIAEIIIPKLQSQRAKICASDPLGAKMGRDLFSDVRWFDDPYKAAENADVLIVLTEWPAFKELSLAKLSDVMATPRLVDLRNIFDRAEAEAAGFKYDSIGR